MLMHIGRRVIKDTGPPHNKPPKITCEEIAWLVIGTITTACGLILWSI
jgi:hypothetical protein